jgi:hypothetical protein
MDASLHFRISPGHTNDGGKIERPARIKYKPPFSVATGLAPEGSVREAAHDGRVVRLDLHKSHLAAA